MQEVSRSHSFGTLCRGFQRVPGVHSFGYTRCFFFLTGGGGTETDLHKNQPFFLFLLGPRGSQLPKSRGWFQEPLYLKSSRPHLWCLLGAMGPWNPLISAPAPEEIHDRMILWLKIVPLWSSSSLCLALFSQTNAHGPGVWARECAAPWWLWRTDKETAQHLLIYIHT